MSDYPDLCKAEFKGKTSVRLKRPTLLAFAFASGKDPFALYNDPKAYAALMDDVGKKLAACKANIKFFWDNKDQLLNGARTGEIVGAMMWDTGGWKLNSENADIQYIAPKSGALGWIDTFALPAKGRNDAAAYAWINFNMRPEIAAKVAAPPATSRLEGRRPADGCQAEGAVREELPRGRAEERQVVSRRAARHRGHRGQGARSREGRELTRSAIGCASPGRRASSAPSSFRRPRQRRRCSTTSRSIASPSATARTTAVDALSLAVAHGSFFSILGPVGLRQDDAAAA